jgi:hypothetical protein
MEGNKTQTGVEMTADNKKTQETLPFNLQYRVLCPMKDQKNSREVTFKDSTFVVETVDKEGCGVDFTSIIDFMNDHKYIFSIVMAVAGLFLCFFGNVLVKWTLALIGFFVGSGGILALFLLFWNYQSASTGQVLAIIFICLAVGIGLGAAMYMITRLAIAVSGGFLGYFVT